MRLHREYAGQHRVVLARPNLGAVGHADQRRAHADPARGGALLPTHRAFQDVLDAQLLTDLLRALLRSLVLTGALPGDDAQAPNAAEPGGDGLGEAVGEVLVIGGAEVLEAQHGEHLPVRDGHRLGPAPGRMPSRNAVPDGADGEHDRSDGRGGAEPGHSA